MSDFVFSVAGQTTPYFATDQAIGKDFEVLIFPSADFEGTILLHKLVGASDTTEEISLPLPSSMRVSISRTYSFALELDAVSAGSVGFVVVASAGRFTGVKTYAPYSEAAAAATVVSDALADLADVVTDLEGDVAGNSVAGAITDLDTIIDDLEGAL